MKGGSVVVVVDVAGVDDVIVEAVKARGGGPRVKKLFLPFCYKL